MNKLTNGKLSKLAVVSIQRSLSPAVIFIFFYFVLSIQYFNYHTIVSGLYATQAVDFYFHCAKIKKPPPIWKRKQLYHPFTYPPICAQDYGRAPSLITCMHRSAKPSLIHSLSQAQLGSDIRARVDRKYPDQQNATASAVSRILRIGLSPTPTLCAFFARLLSSSQSLDFLYIDFTTKILKSQYFFKIRIYNEIFLIDKTVVFVIIYNSRSRKIK